MNETHSVCNKHNIGGQSVCCECNAKTDCSDSPQSVQKEIEDVYDEKFWHGGESEWKLSISEYWEVKTFLKETIDRISASVREETLKEAMEEVKKMKDSLWVAGYLRKGTVYREETCTQILSALQKLSD